MKLQVKNLGPIRQGEIDLDKRFYVFVGYNNSGKTYMAQVVWTVLDYLFFGEISTRTHRIPKTSPIPLSMLIDLSKFENKSFELDDATVKEIIFEIEYGLKIEVLSTFNSNNLEKHFSLKLKGAYDVIKNMGLEIKILDETNFKCYYLEKIPNLFTFFVKEMSVLDFSENTTAITAEINTDNSFFDRLYEIFAIALKNHLNIEESPFLLPANRSFYPSFYKELIYNERIQNETRDKAIKKGESIEKIKSLSRKPYTSPTGFLINSVYKLNLKGSEKSEPNDYYQDLIEELKPIVGGSIKEGTKGNGMIEFSLELEDKSELDMHVASSSANQLAVFYLYLKYWAHESNNFLIIDEPEENEHPENQIKLLNILMRFANRNNNKVLMTTHSPLMTDAVNNHLHLGYLKSKGLDVETIIKDNDLAFDTEGSALEHKDMGIYFFDGKSINEYEIGDYGAFFADFNKAEEKIKETSSILKGYIFDLEKNQRQAKLNKNGIA